MGRRTALGGTPGVVPTVVGSAALALAALVLLGTAAAELGFPAGPAGPAEAGAEDASPAALERRAREVTVRLQGRDCDGFTSGTGFFAGDGRLVTSRHVVEGSLGVGATTADGVGLIAAVATLSADDDLAVVTADASLDGAALADASFDGDGRPADLGVGEPDAGAAIVAAGYPGGGPLDLAHGEVAHYVDGDLFGYAGRIMMITAPVGPGYSGGPLFDRTGRVVGVVVGVETQTGLGLALPIERVAPLLDDRSPDVAPTAPCRS